MFSLCCGKAEWSWAPGAHKRPSSGLWWWKNRKGLKRRANSKETQKTQWRTEKNKHKVLSADLSLFMFDKHPVVGVSPYGRSGTKWPQKHQRLWSLMSHIFDQSVTGAFMCVTPQLFERWGILYLFFSSSRVNQGNLLIIMLFYAKISACIQGFWCKVRWGKPNKIWSTPFNLTGRRMCLSKSQMCWITGNRRGLTF